MVIVKLIEIPDMNPVRFVKKDHPFAGYQTLYSEWYKNQLAAWQVKTDYYQKFQFDTFVGVQIFIDGLYAEKSTSHRLQILDCRGKVLAEIKPSYYGQLPGNTRVYNNTTYSLKTANWQTSFGQYISTEGVYYLQLKLAYNQDDVTLYDYHLSEPIHVKETHPNTRLLEYISFSNKLNVDYSKMFFHMLVEGEILLDTVKVSSVGYDDQNMNPRQQSAIPYRSIAFKMGYPGGCPMWVYDKINRAFCNDYITVDKVRYVREGEIEIGNRVPRYTRYGATLKLREYDADASTVTVSQIPLQIVDLSTKPLLVFNASMKNNGTGTTADLFTGFEITNDAQADSFVSVLNNFSRPKNNLQGYFARQGNYIVFVNGIDEAYDTNLSVVLTKRTVLSYSKSPFAVINPNLFLYASRAAVVFKNYSEVFCYGDGVNYNYAFPSYNYSTSDTTATIRIYHNNTIEQMVLGSKNNNANGAPLTSVTGDIPTGLHNYEMYYPLLPNGFDMSGFPATLHSLIIRYGSIMFNSITGMNKNWVSLHTVDIRNNFFATAMIDSIFNQHYNANGYAPPVSGRFLANGQLPGGAPPTAASLAARNKLIANSWQVITD